MEDINIIIEKLEKEIATLFSSESSGHDIYHLKRVFNLALHIQEKEGGDKIVIGVAAFLHDIHRIIEKETGKYCSPKDSLPKVAEILNLLALPEEKVKAILHCIELHEEYGFTESGKTAEDIESLIVQDADNLDAMGAMGIARAFSYGGARGVPIWTSDIPFDERIYDEVKNDVSEIHHFYSKLLKLKNNMNTKTAREMAEHRHEFMEKYLEEFFAEWDGKK